MFESTQPTETADLMRISAFRRYLDESGRETESGRLSTRLSTLNPTLFRDLQRFEQRDGDGGNGLEPLEVLAAAVRHARRLRIFVQHDARVLPLTVFPVERQLHCPMPLPRLLESRLDTLRVLHVEPAELASPGARDDASPGTRSNDAPLDLLLWELALRGAREDLLPEIAGPVAYRIAPGCDLRGLALAGSLAAAVDRLRRDTHNLRDIAGWPGFDRPRAMRMLNGLYLQAALMVSRTHPAAADAG